MPQLKTLTVVNATIGYEKGYKLFTGLSRLEKLTLYTNIAPYWVPADLFEGLTSLKSLHFSLYETSSSNSTFNKDLFSQLPQLEELKLWVNTVPNLDPDLLSKNNELKEIQMSAGKIEKIPTDFFKMQTKLENLDLRNMDTLKVIPVDLFKMQLKLESLSIEGRWNIKELPSDLLKNQKQLKKLTLYTLLSRDHNDLSPSLLKGLTQLKEIDFSDNSIKSIPLQIFEDIPQDSIVTFFALSGWTDGLPGTIQEALKRKYPKMTFIFRY